MREGTALLTGSHILLCGRLALGLSLLASPWLAARNLAPRASPAFCFALAGVSAMVLHGAGVLTLHLGAQPVTASTLCGFHLLLVLGLLLLTVLRRLPLAPPSGEAVPRALLAVSAALVVLLVPYTHLAGVDTYKWQGLATNVRVARNIPWLIHPLSLLGFTPRSYPAAQPLMLASFQILGNLGVGGGFFVVSVVTALTGLFGAFTYARACRCSTDGSLLCALFYALSPVFMRYTHWATGRGLLLAVLPLYLAALGRLPRPGAVLGLAAAGLFMGTAHKAGLVGAVLFPLLAGAALLLPAPRRAHALLWLLPPVAAAAVYMSPARGLPGLPGRFAGAVFANLSRFGVAAPLILVGLPGLRGALERPPWRRALPLTLCLLPLAHAPLMYAALLALPLSALSAALAAEWLLKRHPARRTLILALAISLAGAGAAGVVAHRSRNAVPAAVVRAARFLEQLDPLGPYRIIAPGRTRVQLHAYVSGCPRFALVPPQRMRLAFEPPPPLQPTAVETYHVWTAYLRGLFRIEALDVHWYGADPDLYYVTVNGDGSVPAGLPLLYDRDGIRIYGRHR